MPYCEQVRQWPRDMWWVLGCYVFFYAVYSSGILLNLASSDIIYYTHFPNPEWLQDDLAGTLWYQHGQPPAMSFLIGIIFKLAPEHYRLVFNSLYFVAAIAGLVFLFFTLVKLGISPKVRLLVMLPLCAFPTLVRFQLWLFPTHLEFCICAAMVFWLVSLYAEPHARRRCLLYIFAAAASLSLIRGQWHPIIWFGFAGAVAWFLEKNMRRTVFVIAFMCMLPAMAWYTKNLYVFGFWGPSSWMGSNVSQVAHDIVSEDELEAMKSAGAVSHDFPADFKMDVILARVPPETLPQPLPHVSLGATKIDHAPPPSDEERPTPEIRQLNYYGIIASAKQDLHDSLVIIKEYPGRYIIWTAYKMLASASIPPVLSLSETMPDLYPITPLPLLVALHISSFIIYGVIPYVLFVQGRKNTTPVQWKFFVTTFLLMIMMLGLGCALNGYEQERMRWGMAPVYFCFVAMLLEKKFRERYEKA